MANLILQSFKCFEETNEGGSDSPYFVIFHGNPTSPNAAKVRRIRKQAWDTTVDSGETVQANSFVIDGVGTSSIVLAAFMEEHEIVEGNGNGDGEHGRPHPREGTDQRGAVMLRGATCVTPGR